MVNKYFKFVKHRLRYETKTGEKMFKLLSKSMFAVLAIVSLNTSTLMAYDCCEPDCNRFYIGAFGGGIYSTPTGMYQMGTAFFFEELGGPLAVNAQGKSESTSAAFGGLQMGYEWLQCPVYCSPCSDWTLTPGLELEAFWYCHEKNGELLNPTTRLNEHDFIDSFHTNVGVYLVNAVFSLNTSSCGGFTPYIGAGVGATRLAITNATSTQIEPPEVGVNHFNSERDDSTWTFAAQAKFGVRYNICQSFHIFGEYRYLFIDSSHYIFGSTVFPGHAATSPWNVKFRPIHNNAFTLGVQYDL